MVELEVRRNEVEEGMGKMEGDGCRRMGRRREVERKTKQWKEIGKGMSVIHIAYLLKTCHTRTNVPVCNLSTKFRN
jgi:hypothetical protein